MEAIDIHTQITTSKQSPGTIHPLVLAYRTTCPDRFLISVLAALRSPAGGPRIRGGAGGGAGLEQALGQLSTSHALRLLPRLADWLSRGWHVELVGRTLRHLVGLHHGLLANTAREEIRDALNQAATSSKSRISELKSLVGMNFEALNFLRLRLEREREVPLYVQIADRKKKKFQKKDPVALVLPG
ncbi:unnamed protein product [Protopolystoma xenopodis]|uniref:Small-subunit processome Utp12 domain-containing protein n=1 Tax=Protopolystoma xenopodis TaxID=117903 RepID=A0A3S5ANZ5_9PLAT|nr:unnamed protein product [Protopolystoma xenopodis]